MFSCLETCLLNDKHITLQSLRSQDDTVIDKLDATCGKNGPRYQLEYALVGNAPKDPIVIIAGKTPGIPTLREFVEKCRSGKGLENAAYSSVYSDMRRNLYRGLAEKTRFFEFLGLVSAYWTGGDHRRLYDRVFTDIDASRQCDIKLTQVCNCSIHTENSDEPTPGAFREILARNPGCLFQSIRYSNRLRLIVFLDTPSEDGRYHPQKAFERTEKGRSLLQQGIMMASLPHPSGSSRVYNEGTSDDPLKMKRDYRYAHAAFESVAAQFDWR